MRIQIGVEKPNPAEEPSAREADLHLGLEDIVGQSSFSLLVAGHLASQIEQKRLQNGIDNGSQRVGLLMSVFHPLPDHLGLVAYQTRRDYVLRSLGFYGVIPEMFPIVLDVPEELQDMAKVAENGQK